MGGSRRNSLPCDRADWLCKGPEGQCLTSQTEFYSRFLAHVLRRLEVFQRLTSVKQLLNIRETLFA